MDMWKAFSQSTHRYAPQAAILCDKFHVLRHLGEALDLVRRSEYARLSGTNRRFIKGQKYTLLSSRENLTGSGRANLRRLLKANKRLSPTYLLRESFEYLWDYRQGSMGAAVLQRRAFGMRNEESLRLKIPTSLLPPS